MGERVCTRKNPNPGTKKAKRKRLLGDGTPVMGKLVKNHPRISGQKTFRRIE